MLEKYIGKWKLVASVWIVFQILLLTNNILL